jgi:hypothetical protein
LPFLLLVVRNKAAADHMTGDRAFQWHGFGPDVIKGSVLSLFAWYVPSASLYGWPLTLTKVLAVCVGLIVSVLLARGAKLLWYRNNAAQGICFNVMLLFLAGYGAFYLFQASFLIYNTEPARYLMPMRPIVLMIGIAVLQGWITHAPKVENLRRHTSGAICLFMCFESVAAVVVWLEQTRVDGLGYSSQKMRSSPAMAYVRKAAPDTRLFSNLYDAVQFYTGRRISCIPASIGHDQPVPNRHLEDEISSLRRMASTSEVLVVYYTNHWRHYLVSQDVLIDRCGLKVLTNTVDATILASPER